MLNELLKIAINFRVQSNMNEVLSNTIFGLQIPL